MKKILFTLLALSAVIVGCSKSEVVKAPKAETPIKFDPYTGRTPVTKASSVSDAVTLANNGGFQVYAFLHRMEECSYSLPYMDKVVSGEVKTTTNDQGEEIPSVTWTYPGYAYWPSADGKNVLNFVAYGLNAGAVADPDAKYQKINYTVPPAVKDQKDLIVAAMKENMKLAMTSGTEPEGANISDGTVNLVFSHVLSRVGFSLVTKEGNTVPVSIEQVNLVGNFYESGSVDLTKTKETELSGLEPTKADRPYITPTGDAKEMTYKLFGENGSYTSAGSAAGTPMYDNSMMYTKINPDDEITAEYISNTFPKTIEVGGKQEIIYTYKNGDEDVYVVKSGENEYLSVVYNDGAYSVGTKADIPEGTVLSEVVDDEAKEAAEADAAESENNRYMMIIPQTELTADAPAVLKVKYFLPGAGTFDEIVVELMNGTTPIQFEAGKSYDFKLKVSTTFIGFSVDVEVWDTATGNTGDKETITLC